MSTRPMRIGLLMHSLNPRGGVVHALELADALVERGHEVTLLTSGKPGQTLFRPTRAQLSVAPLPALPEELVAMVSTRIHTMAAHLRQLPDLSAFDVLHSQDSITANALATLVEEGRISGFVRTVHHLDHFEDPQLTRWQARGVLMASQLCCVSTLWQRELAQAWSRDALLVPNGVNLRRFQAQVDEAQAQRDTALLDQLGVQREGVVWLAVGGVEARKNTVRLLQAFANAQQAAQRALRTPGGASAHTQAHAQQVAGAQLVIAGGASLLDHQAETAAFKAVLADNGLAPGQPGDGRVLVTGPLPDDALPALYRRATALAMPSLCEGFGLCVLEALACGTPAIVAKIAPFTEHLAEHEVLWADPTRIDSIARALWQSLDPDHTHSMVQGAHAVCARMDWAQSARRHEAIYRAVCMHPALLH
jgi:glycosyltransferase involved in cell wall biosynthesis